jgi:polysaccharide pyruvyl transferase WcaK-like protein
LGQISKWTTTSNPDTQTEVWSVISNPGFAVKNNSAKAIFNWSYNWTISEVLECLNRNPQLELIVHDINGLAAVSLPHILKDLKTKAGHIFCLQDKKTFTQEKRFEIATFFGEQSLLRNNPNKKLRELYKYWSYVVILRKEGLSAGQAALLDSEKHLAPSSSVLSEHHAWIKAIENLLAEGYAEGAEIPRAAKSARDAKSLLKALAKKFLKPRGATNKSQDLSFTKVLDFPEIKKSDPRQWSKVLITGWYGTETAGDKAILGEIIHRLRSYNPELEILISSIDLRVSWQTRIEMDLDVKHILIQEMHTALEDPELDAVIMGGGPLMESSQILPIAKLFNGAALKGINRVIFGCGVGPIHTSPMSEQIAHIIKVSNVAFYRDQESLDYALRLGGDETNSKLACDPATAFINRWREANPKKEDLKRISTMLREQTAEYDTKADIDGQNLVFPSRIAEVLVDLKKNSSSLEELNLIPMHVYWRGNDDRLLNHKIANHVGGHISLGAYLGYKGIYELIDSLSHSKLAIAMRYHGHIFSIALNIPFISLDYTGKKGKVSNLMQRLGLSDYSVKFEDFTPSVLKSKLEQIEANPELEVDLKTKTKELTATLEKAYQFFWN